MAWIGQSPYSSWFCLVSSRVVGPKIHAGPPAKDVGWCAQMRYSVVLDSDSDSEFSSASSPACHSDRDSDHSPYQPNQDATSRRNAGVLVEVLDANVRNLDFPYQLNDPTCEGSIMHRVISKTIGDMRFLSPFFASARWHVGFRRMLDTCSSVCIEEVSRHEKKMTRESDRCVVCGTFENSSRSIVHVFCDPSYSASRFLERPEDWAAAFDDYQPDEANTVGVRCLPCGDVNLPMGYKGGFAMGRICMGHLTRAVAAQNLFFDQMNESCEQIYEMGSVGENYREVPTLTESRITRVAQRIAEIMDPSRTPTITAYPHLWGAIDAGLHSEAERLGVDRAVIVGQLARRSLCQNEDSDSESSESEEEGEEGEEEEEEEEEEAEEAEEAEGEEEAEEAPHTVFHDRAVPASPRRSPRLSTRDATHDGSRRVSPRRSPRLHQQPAVRRSPRLAAAKPTPVSFTPN